METVNEAEQFVYDICKRSFLKFWCYANPQGKDKGKELCDVLVVCEPDVLIFSVKEINVKDSGNFENDWNRWRKEAIEKSCKQIYGAERHIKSCNQVIRKDGSLGLMIRKDIEWNVHRIAIALGSNGQFPVEVGDFGKGFVHVMDGRSFHIIFSELDTVKDLVEYLAEKERSYCNRQNIIVTGSEEDLLALYITEERQLPADKMLVIESSLWEQLKEDPSFLRKKEADKGSYVWDWLIEQLCSSHPDQIEPGPELTEWDHVIRSMARENRFSRRLLGSAFVGFVHDYTDRKTSSRIVLAPSGVIYVFHSFTKLADLELVRRELALRCFVARGMNLNSTTVVGISIQEAGSKPSRITMVYLEMHVWSDEDIRAAEKIKTELGYFSNPNVSNRYENEYPGP